MVGVVLSQIVWVGTGHGGVDVSAGIIGGSVMTWGAPKVADWIFDSVEKSGDSTDV